MQECTTVLFYRKRQRTITKCKENMLLKTYLCHLLLQHVSTQACKARWHVSTQTRKAQWHVSMQGTLAREHARHVGASARKARRHVSTQSTLAREHVRHAVQQTLFAIVGSNFVKECKSQSSSRTKLFVSVVSPYTLFLYSLFCFNHISFIILSDSPSQQFYVIVTQL